MDAFDFLTSTTEKPDIIFLSPPWGGPSYLQKDEFYFHMMPFDWPRLLSLTIALTSNLVMYLPRNLALSEIQALAQQIPNIQVEQVFAYGRSRALLIYTGSLACSTGTSSTKPKYLDFTKST